MRYLILVTTAIIAFGAFVAGMLALGVNVTTVPGVVISAEAAAIRDMPIDKWLTESPADINPDANTAPEMAAAPASPAPTTVSAPPVEPTPQYDDLIVEPPAETSAPAPVSSELQLTTPNGVLVTPNRATTWSLSSKGEYRMIRCDEALRQECTEEQLLVWGYVAMSGYEAPDLFIASGILVDYTTQEAAEFGLRACMAHYQIFANGLSNGEARQWLSHDLTDYPEIAHDPSMVNALYEDAGQVLCSAW